MSKIITVTTNNVTNDLSEQLILNYFITYILYIKYFHMSLSVYQISIYCNIKAFICCIINQFCVIDAAGYLKAQLRLKIDIVA